MKVVVTFDEENDYLKIKHPNSEHIFYYPAAYLPELLECLLDKNIGLKFFYQNFGIERTSSSVKIIKSVGKYITLLELTPRQAGKLADTLGVSFSYFL